VPRSCALLILCYIPWLQPCVHCTLQASVSHTEYVDLELDVFCFGMTIKQVLVVMLGQGATVTAMQLEDAAINNLQPSEDDNWMRKIVLTGLQQAVGPGGPGKTQERLVRFQFTVAPANDHDCNARLLTWMSTHQHE
jgi:hypothetical protein